MDREQLVSAAQLVLAPAGLRLAVLFGSAARGTLRQDSDVDIGVLPVDPHMPLSQELDLQASLERAFGRRVDLVRLDQASILLRWRAAREGVLVTAHPLHEWPRFIARAGVEHAEFAPLYARAAEGFRRKLASREPTP